MIETDDDFQVSTIEGSPSFMWPSTFSEGRRRYIPRVAAIISAILFIMVPCLPWARGTIDVTNHQTYNFVTYLNAQFFVNFTQLPVGLQSHPLIIAALVNLALFIPITCGLVLTPFLWNLNPTRITRRARIAFSLWTASMTGLMAFAAKHILVDTSFAGLTDDSTRGHISLEAGFIMAIIALALAWLATLAFLSEQQRLTTSADANKSESVDDSRIDTARQRIASIVVTVAFVVWVASFIIPYWATNEGCVPIPFGQPECALHVNASDGITYSLLAPLINSPSNENLIVWFGQIVGNITWIMISLSIVSALALIGTLWRTNLTLALCRWLAAWLTFATALTFVTFQAITTMLHSSGFQVVGFITPAIYVGGRTLGLSWVITPAVFLAAGMLILGWLSLGNLWVAMRTQTRTEPLPTEQPIDFDKF